MIELKKHTSITNINEPKRVLKYLLLWCKQGTANLVVDEKEILLTKYQALTITSGQIHFFKAIDGEIMILEFSLDFICKDDNDIELIFHNGLFCHFGQNEVITLKTPKTFNDILHKIEIELNEKPYQYLISNRSYIELLLIELNRTKVENGDEIWKPDTLFLKFLELVRNNFANNFTLNQIAEKLQTTDAKLNELSKLHTNKTAQNVIYSLIISEAKRLLIYQNLSIKVIAYQLGFNDPFYFSNFFKKHTNTSPKVFKQNFSLVNQ
jgi:AraC family transcriptional regulator, transcriptional activator of pobA